MKMQSNADFVDMQVKLLISKNPDCNYTELVPKAKELFPMFEWNYWEIVHSVARINKKSKCLIMTEEMTNTTYKIHDKIIHGKSKVIRLRMAIANGKSKGLCKMEKS